MQTTTSTATKRTFLDPIHHDIVLDRKNLGQSLIMDLIDTPEFQRLRRVHQLGVSFYTFQGAEGSRFTHSVGVMYITSLLLNLIGDQSKFLSDPKNQRLIMATALLHDIGHGPYSHVTEKILGYDHEDWSCKIISGDTEVNAVLKRHDANLPGQITSILKKTFSPHYASDIVSSQLDCDRFDYLLRDSYMTGTAYGLFALNRILSSLEVDEDHDRIIVCGEKGQSAVEDYLFARYSMYSQVYYHRKNMAARAQLAKIIKRAKELGNDLTFKDEATAKWLSGKDLSVHDYLFLDDVQMTYHIKHWAMHKDKTLSDLSSRFLNRKLFNATRIPDDQHESLDEIESKASKILKSMSFDPDYYLAVESTGIRPYDYYRPNDKNAQTSIIVKTESGKLQELSTLSPTVEALVKGSFDRHWLVYPHEAKDRIADLFLTA